MKNSSQSKSEPSLRISDWEGVGYTSPYEINNDNGTIRDSNATSTPPHVARNSNGNSGGNSPNRSPANSQRVRLLQVGRLSPVDPKTNRYDSEIARRWILFFCDVSHYEERSDKLE